MTIEVSYEKGKPEILFCENSNCPEALEAHYQRMLISGAEGGRASDIYKHMPLLRALATECEHVTEFGTRGGFGSTTALLAGQPKKFVTWDIDPWAILHQNICDLAAAAGATKFEPRIGSTLEIAPIEPTDFLFIDSLHTARQLRDELQRHCDPVTRPWRVRKFLAFHDTKTFGDVGEDWGQGLRLAIRWFQKEFAFPQWELIHDSPENNGLVVLKRATP